MDSAWLVAGDFNAYLSADEKQGAMIRIGHPRTNLGSAIMIVTWMICDLRDRPLRGVGIGLRRDWIGLFAIPCGGLDLRRLLLFVSQC